MYVNRIYNFVYSDPNVGGGQITPLSVFGLFSLPGIGLNNKNVIPSKQNEEIDF